MSGGATRLPRAFTLSGFVVSDEKAEIADSLESLAALYEVQLESEGGQAGFEGFMNWGGVALQDFAEVDLNMLDAKSVFKNLKDIKDIEEWSFDSEELTEDQIRFKNQWSRLNPLYQGLNELLAKRGVKTLAGASRSQAINGSTDGFEKVFVAGLTAINQSQQSYLNKWANSGKLEVFWDADSSYAEDLQTEAGHFVRSYDKGDQKKLESRIASSPPSIKAVDCSSIMSASTYVREQIMQLTEDELQRTVIVVPDATSLPVLLQALPPKVNGYNVTMGMSLRETPVYAFITLINRIVSRQSNNLKLRYEELMALLYQPVIAEAYDGLGLKKDASRVLSKLAGNHLVWVNEKNINEFSKGPVEEFLNGITPLFKGEANSYIEALLQFLNDLSEKLENSSDPWIKAGLDCVRRAASVTKRLQESHSPLSNSKDVRAVLKKLMAVEKIDLLGEPSEGLQIMGLTETRAIDFDNVFILDCNEGMLPKHEVEDSFIPLDLKHLLKMPGRYEKEATYAYSFYRLFNRSKNVHLLYKSEGATNDGSEISRYILQLKSTFKPGGRLLDIENIKYSMPLPAKRPEIPPLVLSKKMKERVVEWSEEGMSPSAINKMVSCERNFVYRYLLRLKEQTDIQESMESNTIGSIIHYVFEHGLKEFENAFMQPAMLNSVLNRLDELLDLAVEENYNKSITTQGENLILIKSAKRSITKLLNKEINELKRPGAEKILIKGVETEMSEEYTLSNGRVLKFFGLADRIEEADGEIRVVDYKSGNTTSKDLNMKADFEEQFDSGKKGKALQLLVYCAMLFKKFPHLEYVSSGIRSGRNSKAGLIKLSFNKRDHITKSDIDKLINWIQVRLEDLEEEGRELMHEHDAKYCDYCVVLDPPYNPFD